MVESPLTRRVTCRAGAMPHIFSAAADTWMRLFLVGVVAIMTGSVVFAVGYARTDWVTGVDIHPPAQPVPFSHKHHAGQLGIDCRYCHTSVETARAPACRRPTPA